ncbi:MAG: hypothetical protein JWQ99_795 [Blastococcus sp.]|nr:hypothetical protein [Blastococcus sp.]
MPDLGTVSTAARYALGGIRIINGAIGLVAPAVIQKRLGDTAPASNPAAVYGLRLFGIRTVVVGADLLRLRGDALTHAVRSAPLVHASDTLTVLTLLRKKQLAPELARPLALISGVNTLLAVTAFLTHRRSRS